MYFQFKTILKFGKLFNTIQYYCIDSIDCLKELEERIIQIFFIKTVLQLLVSSCSLRPAKQRLQISDLIFALLLEQLRKVFLIWKRKKCKFNLLSFQATLLEIKKKLTPITLANRVLIASRFFFATGCVRNFSS